MCKFVKPSCGHFALFLAILTLSAFLALGIVPLVLSRNYKYIVKSADLTSQNSMESYSRTKGLLLTCLSKAEDKDSITERETDFLKVFPECMILKTFADVKSFTGNSLLLASLRLAYLVFYVAGLFCGVLALLIFVLGYCGLCCASLHHAIRNSFTRWCLSLGFFMFFAAIFFTTGVAIYSQEYILEWDTKAPELPSVYANYDDEFYDWIDSYQLYILRNIGKRLRHIILYLCLLAGLIRRTYCLTISFENLRKATTTETDIGIILMWVAVFSVITSCAMFFLAAFKFKPSYDSDYSESTLSDLYEANVRSKEFRYQANNNGYDH